MLTIDLLGTPIHILGFEFDVQPAGLECSVEDVWTVVDQNHGRAPVRMIAMDGETGRRFQQKVRGEYNPRTGRLLRIKCWDVLCERPDTTPAQAA